MRFRVFLHGKNAVIETDGQPQRLGFFTNRIVEASNKKDAEGQALALLESDEWLKDALLNLRDDPFVIEAEEIEEAAPREIQMTGFSWYPMK